MKKSKVFLFFVSTFLVVAGVVAGKVRKVFIVPVFYYTDAIHKHGCIQEFQWRNCTAGGLGVSCKTVYRAAVGVQIRTLYTNGFLNLSSIGCTTPAYESGE